MAEVQKDELGKIVNGTFNQLRKNLQEDETYPDSFYLSIFKGDSSLRDRIIRKSAYGGPQLVCSLPDTGHITFSVDPFNREIFRVPSITLYVDQRHGRQRYDVQDACDQLLENSDKATMEGPIVDYIKRS